MNKEKSQGEIEQNERIQENVRDLMEAMATREISYEEFEDAFEDRDPFEFM